MPKFAYTGRNQNGIAVSGEMDFSSQSSAVTELLERGITPIKIDPVENASAGSSSINIRLFKQKVNLDELIIFCRQMHALTKAGIPIIRAIRGLAESSHSIKLSETLQEVAESLESGVDLASSMQVHERVFSPLFVSMIHVGENTGQLDESFKQLSEVLDRERETIKRVKQATRYPTMVLVAIAVALLVVNFLVIPNFASVFAKFGSDLPLPTRILQASSNFMVNYWWAMVATTVGGFFVFKKWKNTEAGRYSWDRRKLGFPIVGHLFEQIALSRFTRNFALMLRAGVPVTHALAVSGEASGNTYIGGHIADMRSGIERGESLLRTARNAEIFTPLVLQMMAVGEETGAVDTLLEEVSHFYDEEADFALKRLSESIEPILICAMGGIVLVLALGVFLPIWDLGSAATGGLK